MSDTERLAVIEELLRRLERRLFGNGHPGELSELEERVYKVLDAQEQRVRKLEAGYFKAIGALIILNIVFNVFVLPYLTAISAK